MVTAFSVHVGEGCDAVLAVDRARGKIGASPRPINPARAGESGAVG
jgi:hypothetical protein